VPSEHSRQVATKIKQLLSSPVQTSTRARADAGVAQLTEEFAHLGEAPVLQLPRQARHGGMPPGEALRMAYDGSTASWWVRSTALTLLPRQLPLVYPLPSPPAPPRRLSARF
jgi:hypothetical protein